MPLDKIIIDHLDEQDLLEEKIDSDVELLINSIRISDIMNGSEDVLINIVSELQERLKEDYYIKSSEFGIKLAKDIEKDGDVKIPKSNDPNLNEDIVNAG